MIIFWVMQEAFSNSDLETQHCLQKVGKLETIADHMTHNGYISCCKQVWAFFHKEDIKG